MNKYGSHEDHYDKIKIEPIEFIQANDLSFAVGNVIKYVCRYKYKDGLKDLKKAKDYIEVLIKDFQAKVIEETIQDIDDMSARLSEQQNDVDICDACKLAGAECDIDCECNKLQPDAIANGWNKFIGEFCSIFQAVPLLLTIPVSFGVNTVVLHPQSFSDTKEVMLYIHDLGERLNQFYNAEINLVVK